MSADSIGIPYFMSGRKAVSDVILFSGFSLWNHGCGGTPSFESPEEAGEQCVCRLSVLWRPSGKNECELREKCLEM